jgi:voltage-gated potassium channel
MGFTILFLANLFKALSQAYPLFMGLGLIISALSIWVGKHEGWSVGDSLYFGFVTALTVGYGDMRPTKPWNKFLAIVIGLFGLIATGIIIAIAVSVAGTTFDEWRSMAEGAR